MEGREHRSKRNDGGPPIPDGLIARGTIDKIQDVYDFQTGLIIDRRGGAGLCADILYFFVCRWKMRHNPLKVTSGAVNAKPGRADGSSVPGFMGAEIQKPLELQECPEKASPIRNIVQGGLGQKGKTGTGLDYPIVPSSIGAVVLKERGTFFEQRRNAINIVFVGAANVKHVAAIRSIQVENALLVSGWGWPGCVIIIRENSA